MDDVVDLAAVRAQRDTERRTREASVRADGSLWTVADMLADAQAILASGERRMVKGVFVYLYEVPSATGNGTAFKVGFSQAGMARAEEVGFLALAQKCAIDDWQEG
jgi:hypothetical protein